MSVVDIARVASIGLTTTVILGGVSWFGAWLRPQGISAFAGRIGPNRTIVALILILGTGISITAGYAALTGVGGPAAAIVALAFAMVSGVVGTLLARAYDVRWDLIGISGPSSYGMWPFGPSRTRIDYDRIVVVGQDRLGSYFIEDDEGRRIRWSCLYSGFNMLMTQIEEMCPELFEDA